MKPAIVDIDALAESAEFADALVFNGVNADTGGYLFPRTRLDKLAGLIRGEQRDPDQDAALAARDRASSDEHYGVIFGRRPEELADVGWALIAADDVDPAVLHKLRPLLERRRDQAGGLYRELCDADSGIRGGEEEQDFLLRHHVAVTDVVDPRQLPYYVTLIGSPERIPFEFQYQLGVQHAVGRLDFDTPDEYAQYAHNVIAAEDELVRAGNPRVHVFATRNDFDVATALSALRLAEPLVVDLSDAPTQIEVGQDIGETATKQRLQELLRGPSRKDVLFTATHGLATGSPHQRDVQGALLCQDWRGPLAGRGHAIDPAVYFSGADVTVDEQLAATVIFSFACFSAGTPHSTDFIDEPEPAAAAERPFVARLPQHLLAHPRGGCLAFVGHIDRVWNSSFLWKGIDPQILPFSSTIQALLSGLPLGMAMDYVSQRYASIATELALLLGRARKAGYVVDDRQLARLWLAMHDARNFLILGDPAIRVRPPQANQ